MFTSLDETERLTKVFKYNVFKSCYLEGFEYSGWRFEGNLIKRYKKEEYIWRMSSVLFKLKQPSKSQPYRFGGVADFGFIPLSAKTSCF